jgi:diacylglycerol kinase family enzyme
VIPVRIQVRVNGVSPPLPRSYHVLVNARAGGVLEVGADALARRLARAFAAIDAPAEVRLGAPHELAAVLDRLTDPTAMPVLVGGDGTVTCLLPALLRRSLPFGVLPMGTMNLLAGDLGLTGDLETDVAALHHGSVGTVDVATLNNVPFHSASGLGFVVTVAGEREQARRWIPFSRALATVVAALRALFRNRPVEVEVEAGGCVERLAVDAVLVTVNRFEGSPWRRPRLDEGLLEVHLLRTPGLLARWRAAFAVVTGEWRALQHLRSLRATSLVLRRGPGAGARVTLDGEIARLTGPLAYAIKPGALQILAADRGIAATAPKRVDLLRLLGLRTTPPERVDAAPPAGPGT